MSDFEPGEGWHELPIDRYFTSGEANSGWMEIHENGTVRRFVRQLEKKP